MRTPARWALLLVFILPIRIKFGEKYKAPQEPREGDKQAKKD